MAKWEGKRLIRKTCLKGKKLSEDPQSIRWNVKNILNSNDNEVIGKWMYSEWEGSKGVTAWKAQDDTHVLWANVSLLNWSVSRFTPPLAFFIPVAHTIIYSCGCRSQVRTSILPCPAGPQVLGNLQYRSNLFLSPQISANLGSSFPWLS